jgi:V8-like Glu-specific endopeptidase
MLHRSSKWFRIIASLGLTASSACASEQATEYDDAIAALEAGGKEVPALAGNGRWFEVGDIEVMPDGTHANLALDVGPAAGASVAGLPSVAQNGTGRIVTDDLVRKKRYVVMMPPGKAGVTEDRSPDADLKTATWAPQDLVPKGWSDNGSDKIGDDNRVNLSGTTFAWYQRVGFLGTGCTATMVRQTVNGTFALTAAHCVFDASGNGIGTTFEPARGNSAARGRWNVSAITRYDDWITNRCFAGTTQSDSCRRFDIALLWLTAQSGTTYLGGTSYGWRTPAFLSGNITRFHVGYPTCSAAGAPAGCSGNQLWGDPPHTVGNFRQGDRLYDHSSDLCGGHSGGPMRFFDTPTNDNILIGVQSGEYCSGTCANNSRQPRVNIAVRITEDWFNTMLGLIGSGGT